MTTAITFRDDHARHAERGHPERPDRLRAVQAALDADPALSGLRRIWGTPASRTALERVHLPAYLDLVETFCATGGGHLDADTYATPASWDVATGTCGDLLALVDAVCEGEIDNGFALGRPPGHHARPGQAMGFCLVSNVAVAARHAQAEHGAERVLIVDMDVHHGNGTQETFLDDGSVLFVSSQQDGIYPGSGTLGETGVGDGEGATVNLPVPGGTDDALVELYRAVLPPLAARFRPDLVLLSAGYDAHRLDPLGGLALSVAGLADLVRVVAEVADTHAGGRLVATLEGGYHADALAASVAATLHVLRDPASDVDDPCGPTRTPGPDLSALTAEILALHDLS